MFKLSDVRNKASELDEENARYLVSRLANSPEFSCGNSFGTSRVSCVDLDKVIALKKNIKKYNDFWGVENIEIRKIFPSGNISCSLGNYPNCDVISLIKGESQGFVVSNFVTLCRKDRYEGEVYDKCESGRIMISYDRKWG